MMDPLPPIAKVFALVVQEERQYAINQGMSPSSSPLVFGEMPLPSANASLTNFNLKPKHDCSLYSYCGLQGHTIEKFYKLHGYPPCYKFKSKSFQSKAQVNQIASIIVEGLGASSLDSPLRISSKPHDNDSPSFQVC